MSQGKKLIKLIMVGDTGVGKTSLINRYIEDVFSDMKANTVGVDFFARSMEVFNENYTIQLWDTAGQERFRSIVSTYFKNALGIIIVYDVTSQDSFDAVDNWVKSIAESSQPDSLRIIVGNKSDKAEERVISYEKGKEYADQNGFPYFETSAKSALGVNTLFESIVKSIVTNLVKNKKNAEYANKKLKTKTKKRENCCK